MFRYKGQRRKVRKRCVLRCSGFLVLKAGSKPLSSYRIKRHILNIQNDGQPLLNTTVFYDQQSIASCQGFQFRRNGSLTFNGQNGSSNTWFSIYLSSRKAGKFSWQEAFSKIFGSIRIVSVLKDKKRSDLDERLLLAHSDTI